MYFIDFILVLCVLLLLLVFLKYVYIRPGEVDVIWIFNTCAVWIFRNRVFFLFGYSVVFSNTIKYTKFYFFVFCFFLSFFTTSCSHLIPLILFYATLTFLFFIIISYFRPEKGEFQYPTFMSVYVCIISGTCKKNIFGWKTKKKSILCEIKYRLLQYLFL